jgi:tetratricopeptide (TPR) repeat protein
MGDRAVYCARLESVCAERHPGFESPPIRHALTSRFLKKDLLFGGCVLLFFALAPIGLGEEKLPTEPRMVKTARDEYRAGNFDRAVALLDQLGKNAAPNVDAMDLRGQIYLEQGRFDDAKKSFTAASGVNATRFGPKLHFADVLLREKKFSEARDIYVNLLRETNTRVGTEKLRYAVLICYLFTKDDARAQIALDRIPFPTESPAYYYAQAAWEFAHGHEDDAKKWIKAAAKMFTEESATWFARPLYAFGWLQGKPPVPAP